MSTMNEEITRIETAKTDIAEAINAKGGNVSTSDSISTYAQAISSIPEVDTSDMATKTWVNEQGFSKGVTQEEINELVDTYMEDFDVLDADNYYTKDEVDAKIGEGTTGVDTSDMATKTWVNEQGFAKTTDIQVTSTVQRKRYEGSFQNWDSVFYSDEAEYISNTGTWSDYIGGNFPVDNTEHEYTYNGETYKYKVSYSGTFGDEYTFTFYFEVPEFGSRDDIYTICTIFDQERATNPVTVNVSSSITWKQYVDNQIGNIDTALTNILGDE